MDGGNGVIDLPLYKLDNIAIGLHVEMSEVSVNRAWIYIREKSGGSAVMVEQGNGIAPTLLIPANQSTPIILVWALL